MAKRPEPSSWSTSDGHSRQSGGAWKKKSTAGCPLVAAPPIAVGIGLLVALLWKGMKR